MCLLIASPKKVTNIEWLSNGFDNNSHGAGFVYAHQNKLHVKKGFFTFDKFLKAYKEMPDAPCLIHFRLATGGKLNAENCHPFNVTDKLAFAHNGVFFNIASCDKYSDTYHFNELLIKPIFAKNPAAIFTTAAKVLIEEFIGRGNKLAFINHKGQITLMHEHAGEIEDDTWFSNGSYKYGRRGLCKTGKTVKTYSTVNGSVDQFHLVNHPTPKDWLNDIFLEYKETQKAAADSKREREVEEMIALQAIAD